MRSKGIIVGIVVGGALVVTTSGAWAADASAGQAIYAKQCVACHGKAGAGDGPAAKALKDKPKDWTAGGLKELDDATLAAMIKKGGKAVGKSAAMPAYPKLSDAEVENLVAFARSIEK